MALAHPQRGVRRDLFGAQNLRRKTKNGLFREAEGFDSPLPRRSGLDAAHRAAGPLSTIYVPKASHYHYEKERQASTCLSFGKGSKIRTHGTEFSQLTGGRYTDIIVIESSVWRKHNGLARLFIAKEYK